MIDTDKYEGHTPGPWHEIFMQGDEYNNGYLDLQTLGFNEKAQDLIADAPLLLKEYKRLLEIEQEWLVMWATLEELNLVADVRKDMTLHGIVFPTDEDMEGDEE